MSRRILISRDVFAETEKWNWRKEGGKSRKLVDLGDKEEEDGSEKEDIKEGPAATTVNADIEEGPATTTTANAMH